MSFFKASGLTFHFTDDGNVRIPFVFQHGLGADVNQPISFFPEGCPFRLISLDCRGHGKTVPLGDRQSLRFCSFSDDIIKLLDHLGLSKVVIGGISMGAGVALNFVLRHPDRALGLILSRASWLTEPAPPNLTVLLKIARLIRAYGIQQGKELFAASPEYQIALRSSPANAASLMSQFERERAAESVDILESLTNDVPAPDVAAWKGISCPTLVLGCRHDPLHPFEYAQILAREIPGALFSKITAKATSASRHVEDVRREIVRFIESIDPIGVAVRRSEPEKHRCSDRSEIV
jgi:pimeloyl-ACP methyl ester carboxylesterase